MSSIGAQAWGPSRAAEGQPDYQPGTETWRAADGTIRSRPASVPAATAPRIEAQPELAQQPEPQPQWTDPAPVPAPASQTNAGASYAVPGTATAPVRPAPVPVRQARTAPAPAQQQMPPSAPDGYADPTAGAAGPSGSSRPAPGEIRYDEIGYASTRPVSGGGAADQAIVAVHRSLPANSYVEVTSLDTGRTILVLVTGSLGGAADHPIDLSAGAARLLGANGESIPVRIRTVNPPATDKAALQAGHPASDRPDAPKVLLTALRKRLPGTPAYAGIAAQPPAATPAYSPPPRIATPRPAPVRSAPPAPRPAAQGKYLVQVAALSNASRAQALAQSMGGFVKPGGGLHRVQLGPFATAGEAEAARRRAAGAGYGDARVQAN